MKNSSQMDKLCNSNPFSILLLYLIRPFFWSFKYAHIIIIIEEKTEHYIFFALRIRLDLLPLLTQITLVSYLLT